MLITYNFRLSPGKNKFILVGDKTLSSMVFPIVMDIEDLQKIFSDLGEKVFNKKINVAINAEEAKFEFSIEDDSCSRRSK